MLALTIEVFDSPGSICSVRGYQFTADFQGWALPQLQRIQSLESEKGTLTSEVTAELQQQPQFRGSEASLEWSSLVGGNHYFM